WGARTLLTPPLVPPSRTPRSPGSPTMRFSVLVRQALPVCTALLLAAAAAPVAAETPRNNWPQWRGPTCDGITQETGLPTEWAKDKNIAWTLDLPGRGGSTPVIWGDRMFLTSEAGLDDRSIVLLCVSTAGKELWKRPLSPVGTRTRFMNNEGDN